MVAWRLEQAPVRAQLDLIAALDAAGADAALLPCESLASPDPILIAGAASRRAPSIGLVPTLMPWLQPPFHTARALGTLDALTSGRAGWFVDTAAPTFSSTDDTDRWNASGVTDDLALEQAADDYLAAVFALWNSWEPGALVADVARGQYVDPAKVHVTNHRGDFFSVRGPLNMPRSPQGRPVVFAASGSGAAAVADVVIAATEADVDGAQEAGCRVLLEVRGEAALAPPPTAADGYLVTGVADGALAGQLIHGVLPALVEARDPATLLRDRLGLPEARFAWTPGENA
ncbi:hypothetical protein B7R21_14675 [Subtercola boreus]|uniref:Luciferase-like domain-containing protein n=1 Tax=Subtercola boreus TaxID=120213 RepID=A0A3E0VE39_9MICO|nr:hypothetical protein B7R21_14675 [Subtercola boreus]